MALFYWTLPWILLLLSLSFCPPVPAQSGAATSPPALFRRLCCGDSTCSSRLQKLEWRLGHLGRGRIVNILVSAGVLPSAAAADANSCASISRGDLIGSNTLNCAWATRFFPLRPCSTASVLFLHSSSFFRLRALKDSDPLSHSFNSSLSTRRQQLPTLPPGDYVIEDQGGGCTPLQFRVSAQRSDCPLADNHPIGVTPHVCCGVGDAPFILHTHDKADFISSGLHAGKGWEITLSCVLNNVYAAAGRTSNGCKVLNVGASFGWHAMSAAAAGCSVMAFEPFPPSFQLLQRNIVANGFDSRVHAVQAAASTRTTESSLIVHDKSNNFGYAVLHKGARAMPPSNKSTVYQVVVDTIDSSIGAWGQGQDVNVAVLDCEGHELHALCGGMALLMQGDGVQFLVTEFSPYIMRSVLGMNNPGTAMFSFLSALGYSLSVLDEENGRMSPLNAAAAAVFDNESRSLRGEVPLQMTWVGQLQHAETRHVNELALRQACSTIDKKTYDSGDK